MERRNQLIETVDNILADSDIPLEDKEFWLDFLYSASDKQVQIFVNSFEKDPGSLMVANNLFKEKLDGFSDREKIKQELDLEKSFLVEMVEE